jgi:WD40 repeat protein
VESVAFSPDGKFVLTGGLDITARLWDINSGDEIRVFTSPAEGVRSVVSSAVTSVAFSPDGKYVLIGSKEETARLWDTDYHDFIRWVCSRLVRDFTEAQRAYYGITDKRATCE